MKDADHLWYPHSLISVFAVCCLDSKASLYLVSVAEQAALNLTLSQTAEDRYSCDVAQMGRLGAWCNGDEYRNANIFTASLRYGTFWSALHFLVLWDYKVQHFYLGTELRSIGARRHERCCCLLCCAIDSNTVYILPPFAIGQYKAVNSYVPYLDKNSDFGLGDSFLVFSLTSEWILRVLKRKPD